jgi:hypothetical protein
VAKLKALSQNLPGGIEKNPEKLRIAGLRAKI